MDIGKTASYIRQTASKPRNRLILIAIAACALLFFVSMLALPLFYPKDFIRSTLESALQKATGNHFTIRGEVGMRSLPWPAIDAYDIAGDSGDSNTPGTQEDRNFAKIPHLRLELELFKLFSGDISIRKAILYDARFLLNTDQHNHSNWTAQKTQPETKSKDKSSAIGRVLDVLYVIDSLKLPAAVELRNAVIHYMNENTGQELHATSLNSIITYPAYSRFMLFSGKGLINQVATDWSLEMNNRKALQSLERSTFNGHYTNKEINIGLRGFLEREAYKGDMHLSIASLYSVMPDLKDAPLISAIGTPLELFLKSDLVICKRFSCNFKRADFELDNIKGKLRGKLSIEDEIPSIDLFIKAPKINVNQMLWPRRLGKQKKLAREWELSFTKELLSDPTPIKLNLPKVNANISISSNRLFLNQFVLRKSRLSILISKQQSEFHIRDSELFDGNLGLYLRARPDLPVPEWSVTLEGMGISMEQLIRKLMHKHAVTGTGDINISLNAKGNTIPEILQNLNGHGAIRLANGHVTTVNLVNYFFNMPSAENNDYRRTGNDFRTLRGNFQVNNGVLSSKNMVFNSRLLYFKGAGTMDLPHFNTHFLLTPIKAISLNRLNADNKTVYPLLFSGNMFEPDITIQKASPIKNNPSFKQDEAQEKPAER